MTDYASLRKAMVDCQIRPSDVTKYPIIAAMSEVPREAYVPAGKREVAYVGEAIEIGKGRVVMDPRVLAKMLETANVGPDELVLNVGCGLGYSTAVIARLAEAVVAVEEEESLAATAEETLADQAADNAMVVAGPMAAGAPKHGPYDVIIVCGGVEQVPQGLLDQLKEGGRIVAVFMDNATGECRAGIKTNGHTAWHNVFNASIPVLQGFEKAREFAL